MKIDLPHWFDKASHAVHDSGAIVEKKGGRVLNGDGVALEKWVDAAKHRLTDTGILDIATGAFLAADGHPLTAALRAMALAAAGVVTDELEIVADDAIAHARARLAHATRAGTEPEPAKSPAAPAGGTSSEA